MKNSLICWAVHIMKILCNLHHSVFLKYLLKVSEAELRRSLVSIHLLQCIKVLLALSHVNNCDSALIWDHTHSHLTADSCMWQLLMFADLHLTSLRLVILLLMKAAVKVLCLLLLHVDACTLNWGSEVVNEQSVDLEIIEEEEDLLLNHEKLLLNWHNVRQKGSEQSWGHDEEWRWWWWLWEGRWCRKKVTVTVMMMMTVTVMMR